MLYPEKKLFAKKLVCKLVFLGLLTTLLSPKTVWSVSSEQIEDDYIFEDSDLILETTIQGYLFQSYIYGYAENRTVYLPIAQIGSIIGVDFVKSKNIVELYFVNLPDYKYTINLTDFKAKSGYKDVEFASADYKNIDDTMFFSSDFLSRLLNIDVKVNLYEMTLNIDRETEFPTLVKINAAKKRKNKRLHTMQNTGFKDYEQDNRLIGTPVLDVQLGTGVSYNKSNDEYTNSHSYALNFSTIAGGLDIISYISGNSANDNKPTFRLNAGRTFLDEPPNMFNLKQLKMGDINGISDSYFTNASYGRGIIVSSFKDLVMSANKTIDITGPLTEGWEVELYWNNQLIGFRQNAVAGEYNFADIPVTYGLNTFELVFYGPYGEVRREKKRYYSGTSPVKKGELGYNIAAYQPWKYLIESNEQNYYNQTNVFVFDSNFYYGLSDNTTLMAGITQTPDAKTKDTAQYFSQTGIQYAVKGSSIQYNLERNFDTGKIGHHAEWQGDVYIGNLYAAYDEYGGLHSPKSFYGNEYLKNKTEFRFNSNLPFGIPFYINYRVGEKENNDIPYENVNLRVSKNLPKGWYLSLQGSYDMKTEKSEISPMLYKRWGNFSWENMLNYQIKPESKATDFSSKLTWRDNRYTYWTVQYKKNIEYNMDTYTLSGSKIFPFGGVSLSLNYDSEQNFSTHLTYNISFAKEPDANRILISNNSQFSHSGSVFVKARDENGNPLEGIGFNANNLVDKVYTDENGAAFLTDLSTYEKTVVNVDIDSINDISLQPVSETKKLVLRPGTVKTVEFDFKHFGSIDGYISNPKGKRLYGYEISVIDENGKEVTSSYADLEGYFIVPNVPFGKYDVIISKEGKKFSEVKNITVDDIDIYIGEISLARNL